MMELQQKLTQKQEVQHMSLDIMQKIQPFTLSDASKTGPKELSLDSLVKIEFADALQKKLGIRLEDTDIAAMNTLDDWVDVVLNKQKQRQSRFLKPSGEFDAQGLSFKKSPLSRFMRMPFYSALDVLLRWYFKLDVQGKEHIPVNRPFIIAANHSSHLDNVSLMVAGGLSLDSYVLLAAKDYFFEHKSLRLSFARFLFNLVPFDRNSEPSAMRNNIRSCQCCVEQGKNLIIFPESTRSANGKMQSFKGWCSLLAYELQLPIVPAYIQGAYECMPKGRTWPKKSPVSVVFGQPIFMEDYLNSAAELKYQVYRKITQDLEYKIKQLGKIHEPVNEAQDSKIS